VIEDMLYLLVKRASSYHLGDSTQVERALEVRDGLNCHLKADHDLSGRSDFSGKNLRCPQGPGSTGFFKTLLNLFCGKPYLPELGWV
jgi:hypothetical protein